MPESKLRVGFIGIGAMGTPMAQHILQAGFPLTVYDRMPARTEPFAALGVPVAASCAEVARRSDVVITMIGQVADELDVVLGQTACWKARRPA